MKGLIHPYSSTIVICRFRADLKESSHLGCKFMQSGTSPTFWKNLVPSSSESLSISQANNHKVELGTFIDIMKREAACSSITVQKYWLHGVTLQEMAFHCGNPAPSDLVWGIVHSISSLALQWNIPTICSGLLVTLQSNHHRYNPLSLTLLLKWLTTKHHLP